MHRGDKSCVTWFFRAGLILGLFYSAGCMSDPGIVESAPMPMGVKNIVLVHGAWADGSSWSKIIPTLQGRGYHVVAVQNPLTSFADDVSATKRAIAIQDGPVLLVGHSYAGAVITEAGNDPKVVGLVYVAAFAPGAGESALAQSKPYPMTSSADVTPDASGFLWMSAKGIAQDFAPDLSATEQGILAATQGPWSLASATGNVTTPAWKTKPSWYIVSENDRMISPDLERANSIKMKATTLELPSSHVPMLSHPTEVEAFIEKAAAGSASK